MGSRSAIQWTDASWNPVAGVALRELDTLRATLTAAQAASTRDIDEARRLRRILGVGQGLARVLDDVVTERRRQDAKWGEIGAADAPQDAMAIADGTGRPEQIEAAGAARRGCDRSFTLGFGSWADVLVAETSEVLAESEPSRLRRELVQVAAVCVKWIDVLDRRGAP